ncbi:carboxyl transferase domain-containing protein [Oceaniserpentilla sp. 4NH20-0058]|uniref:carboxyl transferase domain-containing protein n=1 Tax=Oceaniserpentilla sp. 4NH20-0058 TaxID=3127660 RepID=UPI003109BB7D
MALSKVLIANRGEIAIRITSALAELEMLSVAIFAEDDAGALHVRKADESYALKGKGVTAYLDIAQMIQGAKTHGCDAIHPGYGFLSESKELALACEVAGITFVGPTPDTLDALGDKAKARDLAMKHHIPLPQGSKNQVTLDEAKAFYQSLGDNAAIMIKAIAGGGGRGMRPVRSAVELDDGFARCQSEALASFGNDAVYVEQLIQEPRHIEIQIIGDGQGNVAHLGERECSLQRRQQKVIEIAPSPSLKQTTRDAICASAVKLASALNYRGLGTFEFLLDAHDDFYFMEANPRVQVEHTITEAITGVDLVQSQLRVLGGESLIELNLTQNQIAKPKGYAIQLRINTEQQKADGSVIPTSGKLTHFEMPSGPGVRVDGCGFAGFTTSPYYDSLLAKLIVYTTGDDFGKAVRKAQRTLRECHINGVETNIRFLQSLLSQNAVQENKVSTQYIDQNLERLLNTIDHHHPLFIEAQGEHAAHQQAASEQKTLQDYEVAVEAPMQSVVVELCIEPNETVLKGQQVAVLEAMKMEHIITAPASGRVIDVLAQVGSAAFEGDALAVIEISEELGQSTSEEAQFDIDYIRPDLEELLGRKAKTLDNSRPKAVEKRHAKGGRMARENINDLLDDNSFLEYGSLALAAQRRRRTQEELIQLSPADGLVAGTGSINGHLFSEDKTRCIVMSYDYTVFAGTQGVMNHKKTDRMLRLANEQKLPVVFFTEGGGGRPGDSDYPVVAGLDLDTWSSMATLSGLVPLVGIVNGRCFAGNAALLGCTDVIIATKNSNVGMAGPAMIEGGGLGVYTPEEVGDSQVHSTNGVIDILVEDETQAVAKAKQYLSYFQGSVNEWQQHDPKLLRHCIPENRLRSYDIRQVIEYVADVDSVLELRENFGHGIITAFIRIEGRPFGLIASNSKHLGGAIDTPAADKASRFIKLCDAFDVPLISLCDTPGFMVGPEAEKNAQVRHFSRMFVTMANMTIPQFTIVLRKGYGLGAMAMAGGGFHAGVFTMSWPTGEFGAMGLEGAVRLGFKKELAAIEDPAEQKALFDKLVNKSYELGKATSMAATLELDEVIDPAETRQCILRGLRSSAPAQKRDGKKMRFVDTW